MNLRVDLILPTEQRSASVVSVKSLIRIAAIVVPLVLLIVIAWVVTSLMQTRGELNRLEAQWDEFGAEKAWGPKKELTPQKVIDARNIKAELNKTLAIEKSLAGWATSRMLWDEQLKGIRKEIPPALRIQLTKLTVVSTMGVSSKTPVRANFLTMMGVAYGDNAETSVQTFQKALLNTSSSAGRVVSVEVPQCVDNKAPGANKSDRFFKIDMQYKPRKFE